MNICAVLEQQLHNIRVAILRCQSQGTLVVSVHICAETEEQLHNSRMATCRSKNQRLVTVGAHVRASRKQERHHPVVPTLSGETEGHVHNAPHSPVPGLHQRRAVLVHAGKHHGTDDSHVAERSGALQAAAVPHLVDVFSRGRRVTGPGVLLSEAAPHVPEGLVHTRQAR